MNNSQPLRGVSTVCYFAADHAAAKKWYTEFLGLEPYMDKPGYFEFRFGDYQHEFGVIDTKYMPSFDPAKKEAGGIYTYWHVDDINATLERLLSLGATLLDAPQDRGEGFITATVRDPFGNILGIMYNPHYLQILRAIQKL
jgi:catechol 2,3-dioxygenase-like lactoylglutathione lyase family enzyme